MSEYTLKKGYELNRLCPGASQMYRYSERSTA